MGKIPFKVSARTARLIGRENVANADGAIIELVKNCYDADADNCIVYFDNKYMSAPDYLSEQEFLNFSKYSDLIPSYYHPNEDGKYALDVPLGEKFDKINDIFLKFGHIYIIDNGSGMTEEVIEKHWMTIGTDNKNTQIHTPSGRVKTGAKGIGRFSLDRLGKSCEIYTLPEGEKDGLLWKVNWSDFEKPGLTIDQVDADLVDIKNLDLKETLKHLMKNSKPIFNRLNKTTFNSGTIIKINNLSDDWDEDKVKKIYENLEILVPPKEMPIFKVHLFSSLQDIEYGEVESVICDDFDYKVTAKYLDDDNKTLNITIVRNELDINLIERSYMEVFNVDSMKKYPYDFRTLQQKEYNLQKTLYELVPGFEDVDKKNIFNKIGEFSFTLYFLKNVSQSVEKYPIKSISSSSRKKWLNRFSGVKIFRDDFRIRPYGEGGNDWLNLGERQATSPAAVGRGDGSYKIRPNQISGSINISRITNESFQDKSGREGIQENDAFNVFKKIIIGIIEIFENDRSYIMSSFSQLDSIKNERETAKKKAQEVADKRNQKKKNTEENKKSDSASKDPKKDSDKTTQGANDNDADVLAQGFDVQNQELIEKTDELRLARSLASSGLIIASFAHELKHLQTHLKHRTNILKKSLVKLLDRDTVNSLPDYKNPFKMVESIKSQDSQLIKWIKFSLLTLQKNKRQRTNINIPDYFKMLEKTWKSLLLDRSINLKITSENNSCIFRAFHIDLDSIFSNLIANSIDAFKKEGSSKNRIIEISWKVLEENLIISYKDSGCGLSDDYKDPYVIFNAFETTKRDKYGNKIGTGLGMWLVKNIVDDYNGKVTLLKPETGFHSEIVFSLTKQKGVLYD